MEHDIRKALVHADREANLLERQNEIFTLYNRAELKGPIALHLLPFLPRVLVLLDIVVERLVCKDNQRRVLDTICLNHLDILFLIMHRHDTY